MSQLLVPRSIIKTERQPFTKDDQKAMQAWSGFTGFIISDKAKVGNIFTEHSENDDADKERFVIPEKGGDEKEYWPDNETNCLNLNKRKLFFFPHAYLPSILYCMQPLAALWAAIYFIFSLIFGMDNERMIKMGLTKIDIGLLSPFQTFFLILLEIWHNGSPLRAPASLGQNFQDDIISSIMEHMYSTAQTCLSCDQKIIRYFG